MEEDELDIEETGHLYGDPQEDDTPEYEEEDDFTGATEGDR